MKRIFLLLVAASLLCASQAQSFHFKSQAYTFRDGAYQWLNWERYYGTTVYVNYNQSTIHTSYSRDPYVNIIRQLSTNNHDYIFGESCQTIVNLCQDRDGVLCDVTIAMCHNLPRVYIIFDYGDLAKAYRCGLPIKF